MGWDAALDVVGSWEVLTIRTKQSSSLTLIVHLPSGATPHCSPYTRPNPQTPTSRRREPTLQPKDARPNPHQLACHTRFCGPEHLSGEVCPLCCASRSGNTSSGSQAVSSLLLVGGPNHLAGTARTPTLSPGVGIPAISQEMVVTAHQLVTGVVEHAVFAGCLHYQTATRPHHGQEGIQSLSHQDGLRPHMVARVNMCGHSSNRVE